MVERRDEPLPLDVIPAVRDDEEKEDEGDDGASRALDVTKRARAVPSSRCWGGTRRRQELVGRVDLEGRIDDLEESLCVAREVVRVSRLVRVAHRAGRTRGSERSRGAIGESRGSTQTTNRGARGEVGGRERTETKLQISATEFGNPQTRRDE